MKRVTSLLFGVLAAVLLASPAQAQAKLRTLPTSKAPVFRQLESPLLKALKEKARAEMYIEDHAKAALRNADKPVLPGSIAMPEGQATGMRFTATHQDMPQRTPLKAGQQKAGEVVDSHGIITSPAEGVTKFYTRQGGAYYLSDGSVYGTSQSGHVEIVECEDGTVYVKDIISRYEAGTWVKGTKAGNTLTFQCGQPIDYNSNYDATIGLYWWSYDEAGFTPEDKASVVFSIEGDVLTLQDSEEFFFLGTTWSDDGKFVGYADYQTVWTLDASYKPAGTELVELPEDATPEEWTVSGVLSDGSKLNGDVNVAITDDAVYVQGLFKEDFPESWIKGTINGAEVTFPMLQFLGVYIDTYNIWAVGSEDKDTMCDYVMAYDAKAGTLTAVTPYLYATAADDRIYYLEYISNLKLQADMSGAEAVETGAPVDVLPYENSFDTEEEQAAFGIINVNGDVDNYGDEVTWSFNDDGQAVYKYNTEEAADDWLISPAIMLEAGKSYPVSIDAWAYSSKWSERLEIKMGTSAKPSAMKVQVIAPTEISWTAPQALETIITVEKTGYYHFGLHAISDADMLNLYADNFMVGEALSATTPAAPRVIAKADPYGLPKAVVTVMAPQYSFSGEALSALSRIDLFCDGELLKSFDNVEPAGTYITAEQLGEGAHTFRAVAYDADGNAGLKSASVSAYLGLDEPDEVTITDVITAPGTLTVNYNPVTTGYYGGIIVPSDVKYSLWTIKEELMYGFWPVDVPDEKIADGTSTTLTANMETEEGEQRLEYFFLVAENEVGTSNTYVTACLGAPYNLPVEESFAGGELAYTWGVAYTPDAQVGLMEEAADEDGGTLAFLGTQDGDWAQAYLGKVKIEGQNPVLTFQAKGDAGSKINVRVQKTNGKTELIKSMAATEEFSMYSISLKDYVAEPYVKLIFEGSFSAEGMAFVDDIRIFDQPDYDLAISISAPTSVAAGKAAPVKLNVRNNGSKTARSYSVAVKAGSNVIYDQQFSGLQTMQTKEIELDYATSMFSNATSVAFVALVRFEDDLAPENNTASATIGIQHSTAPQPTGVKATKGASSITVTWDAIAGGVPDYVTEDFSAYENGQSTNLGEWTLINANGGLKGGPLQSYTFPFEGTAAAWAVIKPAAIGVTDTDFYGPSGTPEEAYIASTYNYNEAEEFLDNDDWIISPKLDGQAQTIKFYVGSPYVGYGPASFEVLYTDGQSSDYTKAYEGSVTEVGWKEVSVELPEGTHYFAIRNVTSADNAFMLSVANIRYAKGTTGVEKFNIWASIAGEWTLVDDVPGTASSVELTGAEVMKATAVAVSAVYPGGQESKPVVVRFGLGNQELTAITELMASGKSVDVYSIDGKLIRSQANSLEGLKGTYVIEGRKVILK